MCISDVKQFKSLFEYPYGTHTFTIRFVFFFNINLNVCMENYAHMQHLYIRPLVFFSQCWASAFQHVDTHKRKI